MESNDRIDTRLPYRVGYPILPVLPLQTDHLGPNPYFARIMDRVNEILFRHRISVDYWMLAHRFHKGATVANDDITVLIVSPYSEGCTESWVKTVEEIHAYLVESKLSFAVELIDRNIRWGLDVPQPIDSSDHDVLEASAVILPQVKDLIANYEWLTVDILRWYSPVHKHHHPTIVICARDAAKASWWDTTLPSIQNVIASTQTELDVVLLFLDGLSLLSAAEGQSQRLDPSVISTLYGDQVPMGSSCGRGGSEASGTLGGKVLLEKDGECHEYGLTNCHVLLGDQRQDVTQGPTLWTVVSPSDKDYKRVDKKFSKDLERAEEALKKTRIYHGLYQGIDKQSLSPKVQDRVRREEEAVAFAEIRLKCARDSSRDIGTIFASSGYTTCPASFGYEEDEWEKVASEYTRPMDSNWALDWCLFRLKPGAEIDNRIFLTPTRSEHLAEGMEVTTWAHVHPRVNYKVMKRGRSTGWTKGKVSAVLSMQRSQNGPPKMDPGAPTMIRDHIKGMYQDELIVAHCIVSESDAHNGMFMLPGDSGSLVLLDEKDLRSPARPDEKEKDVGSPVRPDEKEKDLGGPVPPDEKDKEPAAKATATVLGLCFALNDAAKTSYMIPMQLVVKSINEVTGGEVVHPSYRAI
ncbi:hypothetical protein CC80DRAFT_581087 [Byssothecium circinans]|uniref:Uncharacterized protein n=1 Tax=Byssothecium circinans TaxID=147558 RepID=A0A6A5TAB4_9PLEO|nr:hypothetical protein CC80DRAFT_581087 [Byssothecium circinans]